MEVPLFVSVQVDLEETSLQCMLPNLSVRAPHSRIARAQLESVALASSYAAVGVEQPWAHMGRALGERLIPHPVADALTGLIGHAEDHHAPIYLGLDIRVASLVDLQWDALEITGIPGPLMLHDLITVYRQSHTPPSLLPSHRPLHVVLAIAEPDDIGKPGLDFEREMRAVVDSVRRTRSGDGNVTVVDFATTRAIRSALQGGSTHVLHLSCHGYPGYLLLEDDSGRARPVTSAQFLQEAIPPGCMPPVVYLAACRADDPRGAGYTSRLLAAGASVVIGTTLTVSDQSLTQLSAEFYRVLADQPRPDPLAALAEARRAVARIGSDATPDWMGISVSASTSGKPLFNERSTRTSAVPDSTAPVPLPSPFSLPPGKFVGRRTKRRALSRILTGRTSRDRPGVVVYGVGGVGKSALAGELARLAAHDNPGLITSAITNQTDVDSVMAEVCGDLRGYYQVQSGERLRPDEATLRELELAASVDLPWRDRFGILRRFLARVPVLIVFDNFEDNLEPLLSDTIRTTLHDRDLAELLAFWISSPERSHLLFTTRRLFELPKQADRLLHSEALSELTPDEARRFARLLPTLDCLPNSETNEIIQAVGGHPRTLEYVDALLAQGEGHLSHITRRLAMRLCSDSNEDISRRTRSVVEAISDAKAITSSDNLLTRLLEGLSQEARRIIHVLSVYREPFSSEAIELALTGSLPNNQSITTDRVRTVIQELRHRGLLAAFDDTHANSALWSLHRWTADSVIRLATDTSLELPPIGAAHRQAATYWNWQAQHRVGDRVACNQQRPESRLALANRLEARHHLFAATQSDEAQQLSFMICDQLHDWGAWEHEASIIEDSLDRLPPGDDRIPRWIDYQGRIAKDRDDFAKAQELYEIARNMREDLMDRSGIAYSLFHLGILAHVLGDFELAHDHLERSLGIRQQLGEEAELAASFHYRGHLRHDEGYLEGAGRDFEKSLRINERIGDAAGMASCYNHLGKLNHDLGDDVAAEEYLMKSLDIKRRLGNLAREAIDLHALGKLARDRGETDKAREHLIAALQIRKHLGSQARVAETLLELGRLSIGVGDYVTARVNFKTALNIQLRLGHQRGVEEAEAALAGIAEAVADD